MSALDVLVNVKHSRTCMKYNLVKDKQYLVDCTCHIGTAQKELAQLRAERDAWKRSSETFEKESNHWYEQVLIQDAKLSTIIIWLRKAQDYLNTYGKIEANSFAEKELDTLMEKFK